MQGFPAVVTFYGRLTSETFPALRRDVQKHTKAQASELTIDLRNVTHYDSATLGAMLKLHREIERSGTRCSYLAAHPPLRKLLMLSGCMLGD